MLSTRLVSLIESHSAEITRRLTLAVKAHPDLPHLAQRPEQELCEWCQDILQNVGYLLSAGKDQDVQRRFEVLGRTRYEEQVPLAEAVLRTILLKQKIFEFIDEQGFAMNALQIYAEEELEQRVGRFFDGLIYHLVRGYENARKRADELSAA